MSFDWSTFALQLVNALILLAILRHFLFRPVAAIIAQRQAQAQAALNEAQEAKARAEAATASAQAEVQATAKARAAVLAEAHSDAETARGALLAQARDEAARIVAQGQDLRAQESAAAGSQALARARDLAGDIARRALSAQPANLRGYLDRLTEALSVMSDEERDALLTGGNLRLTSARPLAVPERDAALAALKPFGVTPNFDIAPELIAGLELRSDTGDLRNSLDHDLDLIAEAMRDDRAR